MSTQPNPSPDPSQVVHMFDPDGNVRAVPYSQAHDALAAGGKPALRFQAPDGSLRFVPADKTQDAVSAGGKLLPLEQQAPGIKDYYGFTPANVGSNVWQGVKGIIGGSYSVAKDLIQNPNWVSGKDSTASKFIEKPSQEQVQKAGDALASGDRVAAAGHILASSLPLIGPWAAGLGEQAGTGDVGGAVGQAAGTALGGELLAKGAQVAKAGVSAGLKPIVGAAAEIPSAVKDTLSGSPIRAAQNVVKAVAEPIVLNKAPEDQMVTAVKPTASNTGFRDAMAKSFPVLKEAEQTIGKPVEGVDDALAATNVAKKATWAKIQARYDTAQGATSTPPTIDGGQIAEAMNKSVDERQAMEDPSLPDHISEIADRWRNQIPIGKGEDYLQSINNELQSFYSKNKVGRQAALGDPTMAYKVAQADALRGALNSKLDELAPPTGDDPAFSDLKKTYGALSNVEGELLRRKNVAARQQPMNLQEQIAVPAALGKIAGGAWQAALGRVPEGMENIREGGTRLAVSEGLKQIMTTDNLIKNAFERYGPSPGASASVPAQIGGAAGKAIKTLSGTRGEAGPPGSVSELDDKLAKVNNSIRTGDDTALYQQAREDLGANATFSDVAKRAQDLKTEALAMRRTPADTMQDVREAAAKDPNLAGLDAATRARAVEMRQKYPVKAGSLSAKALKDFYANR